MSGRRALGAANLRVDRIKLGGPALVNDLLTSGPADIVVAGPPAFLTLLRSDAADAQDQRRRGHEFDPIYLNTRAAHLHSLTDLSPNAKIAVTAVKLSISRKARPRTWQDFVFPSIHRLPGG